ncbi:MAG: hydantoinase B/oxoprolinase family protein, partial [Planctomycetota bacterium]
YGVDGGGVGAPGRQYLVRQDAGPHQMSMIAGELAGVDHAHLSAGDQFVIETPGGGGWGALGSSKSDEEEQAEVETEVEAEAETEAEA